MNTKQATEILKNWFAGESFRDVPLLETEADRVTPILIGASDKRRLSCSTELVDFVGELGREIIRDWSGNRAIRGISYLIYCRNEKNQIDPLYVGVASSGGRTVETCSSLWRNRGARFSDGYGSNGHLDCLSRALFKSYKGYADWIPALFAPVPAGFQPDGRRFSRPVLSRPIYVHIEKWDHRARRMFPAAPDAPLFLEEMLRLWILREAGIGSKLLNRMGT